MEYSNRLWSVLMDNFYLWDTKMSLSLRRVPLMWIYILCEFLAFITLILYCAPRLWLLPAVVPSPVPGSQRRRDGASAAAVHLALPRMHQEAGELCCSFHRYSRRWDALDRAATFLSAENRPDRRLCEQSQTIAVSGVAAQYKEGQIGTEKVRYGSLFHAIGK